jgi:predicted metal-dependent peptidase
MNIIENPTGDDAKAARLMAQARINVLYYQAFFGGILVHLKPAMTRDCETMATDSVHLFFNPDYVLTLSKPEIEGVQIHECLHVALLHFARLLSNDPHMWNVCTDFAINRDLKKGKIQLPGKEIGLDSPKGERGHLFDPRFEGMSAEQILAYLRQHLPPPPQGQQGKGQPQQGGQGQGESNGQPSDASGKGQGQPGKGKGQGQGQGQGDGGKGQGEASKGFGEGSMIGEVLPAPGKDGKPMSKAELADQATTWEIRVRQAVAAADKRAGFVPGAVREMIDKLNNPEMDWNEKFRGFVGTSLSRDSTWDRPNRRFEDAIVPSRPYNAVNRVLFLIDTSGSMSVPELRKGLSEGEGMLNDGEVDEIVWACIDTRVASHGVISQGESFERFTVSGRGGTNFRQPMQWANEQDDVAAIVCFTDGAVSSWGEEPGVPVLWIGCERHKQYLSKAPFGEVAYLK